MQLQIQAVFTATLTTGTVAEAMAAPGKRRNSTAAEDSTMGKADFTIAKADFTVGKITPVVLAGAASRALAAKIAVLRDENR